jgi:uncharacterized membrane protein YidH (DUF202 family)
MAFMNQLIAVVLLLGGIVLIFFGISASQSFSSDVSKFFTGSPTDKAIWMIISGVILALVGIGGSIFSVSK